MSIAENLHKIKNQIPKQVKLVAVSKTKTVEEIMIAYNSGQRIFGENKVQELMTKYQSLPKDIEWHMIGHLQSNKVKYIAPFINLIHSVDNIKLLEIINYEAKKNTRIIDCLLQIHIASEETKFGLTKCEAEAIIQSEIYKISNNMRLCGIMGMATYTKDMNKVRKEFRYLRSLFHEFKEKFFIENHEFNEISMGMSVDYPVAIEEGSTIIRLGSIIFGERIQN
jgi:hypothetical protein